MHNKPRVAVLLAAYQGIQWIEEQVHSILTQHDVEVELFISVDACTPDTEDDGTFVWCQSKSDKHSNVNLLPYGERFGGAGANFFRLIRDVDFDCFDAVSFADQDDKWLPNKLARAWQVIRQDGYHAYSSDVMAFWPDGREFLIKKSYPQKRLDYFFEAAGPGCTYVFSREAAFSLQSKVRGAARQLESVALHDWFAYAYCREQGFNWFIDEQVLMYYRQHTSNQIGVNKGWKAYIKRIRQVFNNEYRGQVLSISHVISPSMYQKLSRPAYRFSHVLQFRRRPRDCFALFLMFVFCIY